MTRWETACSPSGAVPDASADGLDQRAHQVHIVIVVLALEDRGDSLQTHAGVDGGARQVDPLLLRHLLELHEDEVPDLDEPVAILFGADPAGRPGCDRHDRRKFRNRGRKGPVSPIAQKLSEVGIRMIFDPRCRPAIFFQRSEGLIILVSRP